MKDEESRGHQASAGQCMVPAQMRTEVKRGEDAKDDQRDDFLDNLELDGTEVTGTDAVRRYLEAVFKKGNCPTHQDDFPQSLAAKSQVAVPGKSHEDIGDDK